METCASDRVFSHGHHRSGEYKQDPRSPRKSAMDLFKAGLVGLTSCALWGKKTGNMLSQEGYGSKKWNNPASSCDVYGLEICHDSGLLTWSHLKIPARIHSQDDAGLFHFFEP